MQPETMFKNRVRPKLEAIPRSFWVKIQMLSIRGIPDFLGCVNGKFVALELKVGKNKVGKKSLQGFILDGLRRAGAYAREMNPGNEEEILEELRCLSTTDIK